MLNDIIYEWEQFPLGFYDLVDVNQLLPQLALDQSKLTPPLSSTRMMEMRTRKAEIVVARDNTRKHVDGKGAIIAIATVFPVFTTTDAFGFVEDVVTDEPYHRLGISETINRYIIARFRFRKFRYLELHSHKKRTSAHALYEKIGYVLVAEDAERKSYRFYL